MSFNNFQQLNDALAGFKFNANRAKAEKILDVLDQLSSLANSTQQQYSRAYAGVQWMKYDTDGNPSDVTPSDQLTVPAAVLANTVSQAQSLLSQLDALSGSPASSYAGVVQQWVYINGSDGFTFRPSLGAIEFTSGLATNQRVYLPHTCVLHPGSSSKIEKNGHTAVYDFPNATQLVRFGVAVFENVECYVGTISVSSNISLIFIAQTGSNTGWVIYPDTDGGYFSDPSHAVIASVQKPAGNLGPAGDVTSFQHISDFMQGFNAGPDEYHLSVIGASIEDDKINLTSSSFGQNGYNITLPDMGPATFSSGFDSLKLVLIGL